MKNKYEIRGDHTIIFLYHKGEYKECIVDTKDLSIADSIRGTWSYKEVANGGYAKYQINKAGDCMYLHKLICECPEDMVVDHINKNKLDNRRDNLRPLSAQHNSQSRSLQRNNTSGIPGVGYDKAHGVWIAQIRHNNKSMRLGQSRDKHEAGRIITRWKSIHQPYGVHRVPIKMEMPS